MLIGIIVSSRVNTKLNSAGPFVSWDFAPMDNIAFLLTESKSCPCTSLHSRLKNAGTTTPMDTADSGRGVISDTKKIPGQRRKKIFINFIAS